MKVDNTGTALALWGGGETMEVVDEKPVGGFGRQKMLFRRINQPEASQRW